MNKNIIKKIIDKIGNFYIQIRSWILALTILGFTLVTLQQFLWSTQKYGIGIRTDSVAYLWSAENIVKGLGIGRLDGDGTFRPYTHWPPLYPIILAGFDILGFGSLTSARILGAICITLQTVLTGLMVAKITNGSPGYVAGALVILNNTPYFWEMNYYAMTEPIYMVLSITSLLLLDKFIERREYLYLIIASILVSLTILTRYVGLSMVVVSCTFLFLQKKYPLRRKIRDGLLIGLIGLVPIGIWIIRNLFVSGNTFNRSVSFITMTSQQWEFAYRSIQSWFDPLFKSTPMGFAKPILIISLAFNFSIIYFRFFPQREKKYETNFIILLIVYTISYTVFTIIARLLFDPYIPLDESRIQYPTYIGLFLLLIYGLYRIQSRIQNVGWFKPAILVSLYIFGVWVFARGYKNNSYNLIFIGHKAGLGLVRMTDENLLSALMQYPLRDYRLFSDNIEKLYFLSKINSYSITSNPNDEIEKILIIKKDYGVVVVLFDQQVYGPEYMSMIPGLHLIYKGIADVYVAP